MLRHLVVGTLLALGLVALATAPTDAVPLLMDYTGFVWESSIGGQMRLQSVGVLDDFLPIVQKPEEVYTYYIADLALTGVQTIAPGFYLKQYRGGAFSIYESTGAENRPYSYGTNPGAAAPSSFVDGDLWLAGTFDRFSLLVDSGRGLASYTGAGRFDGGSYLSRIEEATFSTFGGMTASSQAQIPAGYTYRLDGQTRAMVAPVPEPSSLALLGSALFATAMAVRRKKQ